jgi:hypothetical protein
MATLEGMRANIQRLFKEPIDDDELNGHINEGYGSLWGSLILVNPGEYLSRKPIKLTNNDDILPFDEISASEGFVEHYALTHLSLSVHEYAAADKWEGHVAEMRLAAILEAKQMMQLQETVTPFRPRGSNF